MTLKKKVIAGALALLLTVPVYADFDKGIEAYQAGNYAVAYQEFKSAAKNGDASAQFGLAFLYANGHGVEQDYERAVYWIEWRAKQGDADAQFDLAVSYEVGDFVTQDYKRAFYWYEQAAKQGHIRAQYNLAISYFRGEGTIQDYIQAHKWMNIASANGHARAREARDEVIAPKMTREQIQQAQTLAREFFNQ